jgi:SPP1 gp7 family putative phage head morphogenesis protein
MLYCGDLRVLTGALKHIAAKYLLPELRREFPGSLAHDAGIPPRLHQIVGDVARRFGGVQKQAEKMASLAAQRTLVAVDERLARSLRDSMSVNIEPYLSKHGRIGKVLGEKTIENVDLIKTIPEEYFQGIADTVAGNWRTGGRWENIISDIERVGEDTDARAEVIARDQTAKLNSAFNQVRQTDVGIEQYEWASTDDERTRPDHWALNTTIHRWDEPGPLEGTIDGEPCHPGEDILCRCDAIPYVDLDALEAWLGLAPMEEENAA